jgi:hypothetical protein
MILNQSRVCKIQQEGYAIKNDLDAIIFNPIASTIPKWRALKPLKWMQNLLQSTSSHEVCVLIDIQRTDRTILSETRNTNG